MEGKTGVKSYRELVVWRKAIQLAAIVYRMTRQFPREEVYGLSSQIRRAAVSVPSNIAEGQGRMSRGEFRHFLGIARGSNFELQSQLEIARVLEMGELKQINEADTLSQEVGKMINAILGKLDAKPLTTNH
ncbi:MAG TPA: four helix bundle protein [Terracidiphilus sp.]|nr:four helix bundle protein [Terracidiphilus sp.]